jgi:hypothetical protein
LPTGGNIFLLLDTAATNVGNETAITTIPTVIPTTVSNETVKVAENTTEISNVQKSYTVEEPRSKTELKISSNKTDTSGSIFVIFLEKPLLKGNYSLEIDYEATVDDRVLYMRNVKKNNASK